MVRSAEYAPYIGFSETDVVGLCERHGLELDDVKRWYDGYEVRGQRGAIHGVCAPYSVVQACRFGKTGSYWPSTEAYELLVDYIDMNFDDLQDALVQAIGGDSVSVDPDGFQNDMVTITSRDDVLTLFVHLGYLTYDADSGTARVPNDEM